MKPFYRLLVLSVAAAACGTADSSDGVSRDAPPAAAVLAPGQAGDLSDELRRLVAELDQALADEPERILTAEAMSDRLMQARRPTDWLATGYDVEARLRQMQTMADRLVAMLRRGMPMTAVESDVRTMQMAVQDLLDELERSSPRPKPLSLDTLLARVARGEGGTGGGLSHLPRVAPPPSTAPADSAGPVGTGTSGSGGPLGVPVRDTTGGGPPDD